MAMSMKGLIAGFVATFIGVILIGPLQTVVTEANLTGLTGTVVSYVPVFFGLTVLLGSIAGLY